MSKRSPYKEIEKFLSCVRQAIDGKNARLIPRKKNLCYLIEIGIKVSDAIDEVYSLKCEDYLDGPKPNENIKHSEDDVWMFKKKVEGHNTYIKMSIMLCNGELAIISFHADD